MGFVSGQLEVYNYVNRIGESTPIALTAVIEYLCAELFEITRLYMIKEIYDKKHIEREDIRAALEKEDELFNLLTKWPGVIVIKKRSADQMIREEEKRS